MKRYEENRAKHAIILHGTGPNFCPGADLIALYNAGRSGDRTLQQQYIKELLQLVYYMATMSKPVFGVMHGRTMGVGAALGLASMFPVATDTTEWAVPGPAFGYFPDGGLLYWLSHFGRDKRHNPSRPSLSSSSSRAVGLYLVLTGKRVECSDLVHLGLASKYMTLEQVRGLHSQIGDLPHGDIRSIIQVAQFFQFDPLHPFRLGTSHQFRFSAFTH
jgi:enoyl-CoA hydratase